MIKVNNNYPNHLKIQLRRKKYILKINNSNNNKLFKNRKNFTNLHNN